MGVCSLLDVTGVGTPAAATAEIGVLTAAWERGQGVTTAAVRLVAAWAFNELGVQRLEWQAVAGNEASRRVAARLGFVIEGVCRRRIVDVVRGTRSDGWLGSLLPGELQ